MAVQKEVPKPPDGGYGWIVLFASFFISCIVDGIMYSFGLVTKQIALQFDVSDAEVNLLTSLYTGFLFCSGPLVAGFTNKFGCRVVIIGGAIITSIMYVITAFSPSLYVQLFVFGFIGGISHGCTYIASLIIIAEYFEKKRGFATGITMAGSGVGSFAFAPLLEIVIRAYDWKFTMIIMACLFLFCAFLGAVLRPLKFSAEEKRQHELKLLKSRNEAAIELENSATDCAANPVQTFSGSVLSLHQDSSESLKDVMLHVLKDMTDFSLLWENKGFLLIVISNFVVFLGYFVPFLYIPKVGEKLEIENHPFLLSIIGIVNIPFRIIYGIIADRNIITPVNLNTLAIFISAVPFFFYALLETFMTQCIFSVTFAVGISGMNSLTTMYLIQLVGMYKFNKGTGIVNLFRGFACFVGPPIAGAIVDNLGTFPPAFYYSGVMLSIGFLFTFLVSLMTTVESMKKKKSVLPLKDSLVVNEIMFDECIHKLSINENHLTEEEKSSMGLRALVRCAVLANESYFLNDDDQLPISQRECTGSDIDRALLKCCESIYPNMVQYREQNRRVYAMPSNNMSKYQLYVYQTEDNDKRFLVVMKGMLDIIMQHCSFIFINGSDLEMDASWHKKINSLYEEMSARNDQVICFCDIRLDPRQYPENFTFDPYEVLSFSDLRLMGMVGLNSPRNKLREIA